MFPDLLEKLVLSLPRKPLLLRDSQPLDHIKNQLYLPSSRSLVLLLKESRLYPPRHFHAYLPRLKQPGDTSN